MAFDPKCDELAAHFLPEDAPISDKADLSQAIQDAAEEWLNENGYGPDKDEEDTGDKDFE